MSNKNTEIFNKKYNSYGEAVGEVLKSRNLEQKWLVKQIKKPKDNFRSLQQQVSRWVRGGNISDYNMKRINTALDIAVKQDVDGKWIIASDTLSKRATFDVDRVEEIEADYTDREPTLDDLPRLIRLKRLLEDKIDEVLKK